MHLNDVIMRVIFIFENVMTYEITFVPRVTNFR
jgi:hypothetical protein